MDMPKILVVDDEEDLCYRRTSEYWISEAWKRCQYL